MEITKEVVTEEKHKVLMPKFIGLGLVCSHFNCTDSNGDHIECKNCALDKANYDKLRAQM